MERGKKEGQLEPPECGHFTCLSSAVPSLLTPETSFMEDDFCMNGGLAGSGEGMVSV